MKILEKKFARLISLWLSLLVWFWNLNLGNYLKRKLNVLPWKLTEYLHIIGLCSKLYNYKSKNGIFQFLLHLSTNYNYQNHIHTIESTIFNTKCDSGIT